MIGNHNGDLILGKWTNNGITLRCKESNKENKYSCSWNSRGSSTAKWKEGIINLEYMKDIYLGAITNNVMTLSSKELLETGNWLKFWKVGEGATFLDPLNLRSWNEIM